MGGDVTAACQNALTNNKSKQRWISLFFQINYLVRKGIRDLWKRSMHTHTLTSIFYSKLKSFSGHCWRLVGLVAHDSCHCDGDVRTIVPAAFIHSYVDLCLSITVSAWFSCFHSRRWYFRKFKSPLIAMMGLHFHFSHPFGLNPSIPIELNPQQTGWIWSWTFDHLLTNEECASFLRFEKDVTEVLTVCVQSEIEEPHPYTLSLFGSFSKLLLFFLFCFLFTPYCGTTPFNLFSHHIHIDYLSHVK